MNIFPSTRLPFKTILDKTNPRNIYIDDESFISSIVIILIMIIIEDFIKRHILEKNVL